MYSDIEKLLGMKIIKINLINKRCFDDDVRYIYKLELTDGLYCLKLQDNNFTSMTRVNKTAELVKKYNDLGLYCPKYIKLLNGSYSACIMKENRSFVMWIEEYVKFEPLRDSSAETSSEDFQLQIAKYIGEVATRLLDFHYPFKSPYIMFEPFDETTCSVDEYEEFFTMVYDDLRHDRNIDHETLEYVKDFFYSTRKKIKAKYLKLPESVFQSDLQDENLITKNGELKGLIDFNLAGTEKVLTYFINETAYQENNAIGDKWISDEYIHKHSILFKKKYDLFTKYYTLNNLEKEIFEDLYKIIVPFKYYPLTEIRGYYKMSDYQEVNYRILWMKKIIDQELRLF